MCSDFFVLIFSFLLYFIFAPFPPANIQPNSPRNCSFDDVEQAYTQCKQLKDYIDDVRTLADKHTVRLLSSSLAQLAQY